MEADIRKNLVILLERDFKNERLQKNPPKNNLLIRSKTNLKSPVNDLLEEIKEEVDDVVEILPEDITDISSDDDFDPLPYEWEQDEWYQVKLQKQGEIATNNKINRINSGRKANNYVKKHIKDKSHNIKLNKTCGSQGKTRVDPIEDNSDDENGNKSDSEINEGSDYSSTDGPSYNKQVKVKKKLKNSVMKSMSKEEELILKTALSFSCSLCGSEVKTSREKNAHKKIHKVKTLKFARRYRCSECSKVMMGSSFFFKMHWQTHAGKQIFSNILSQCPHCPCKLAVKQQFKQHLLAHKEKKKFQCEFCTYSCDHQKDLTKHLFLHKKFPSGTYSCNECSFTTKCDTSFYNHKRYKHTPAQHKVWCSCPHCPFKTSYKESLRRHLKHHNQRNGIKCPQCTYTVNTKRRAREHLKLHYDKEEDIPKLFDSKQFFPCPHCPYKTTQSHLEKHLRSHGIGTKLYCANCPFSCMYKSTLIGHLVLHKRRGRYKCPWCSYSNDTAGELTKHKRLHRDDREAELKNSNKKHKESLRCPTCKKIFQFPAHVKRHMMTHQKLNECKEAVCCANCPYKAKQKDKNFIEHVQGHLKKDGLKCDYCSFRHDKPTKIRIHMSLHADSK